MRREQKCVDWCTILIFTIFLVIGLLCTMLGCNKILCPLQEKREATVSENSQFIQEECTSTSCARYDTKTGNCAQETISTYDCSHWVTFVVLDNNHTCVLRMGPLTKDVVLLVFFNTFDHSCNEITVGMQILPNIGIVFLCVAGLVLYVSIAICSWSWFLLCLEKLFHGKQSTNPQKEEDELSLMA